MATSSQALTILLRAWVVVVAVVAACGWICGAAGASFLLGPVALALLLVLAVRWRRELASALRTEGSALVRCRPVVLLAGLILILAFAYEVSVHDTLTYRLPRIRLWMQDSGLEWYDGAELRINSLGRNWEWLGMALLQLTRLERLLVLPSLVSWFLLARIFYTWSERYAGGGKLARAAALILITSPLIVVQGFTTMNDLLALALVAASVAFFIEAWESEQERGGGMDLIFSGLALAVATGVKPNLGTLAVIWCAGALFWWKSRQGALPWRFLAAAVPLGVIASGLPTLIMNYAHTGSPMGKLEVGDLGVAPAGMLEGVLLGNLMFWWQSAQPVFNPFAEILNSATGGLDLRFSEIAARFHLKTELFRFGESTTVGTFTTILLVAGIVLALGKTGGERKGRRLFLWLALGALLGMSLNFALAIPYELGRSSAAFVVPIVPLALLGIGALSSRGVFVLRILAVVSLVSCLLHLLLEPNRSLLPAEVKAGLVEKIGGKRGAAVAEAFRNYRSRRFSGKELFEQVPAEAGRIVLCLDRHAPTAAAWRYLPRGTKVRYLRASTPEELWDAPEDYFILVGSEEMTRQIVEREDLFEVAAKGNYLIRLKKGERPWYLLRKLEPVPER